MPKILLLSATQVEIQPLIEFLKKNAIQKEGKFHLRNMTFSICISGVGMVNTAFELGQLSSEHFDLAIQAGIAGSFGHYPIGTVVRVDRDCFSEMGAQNDDDFLSMDELKFGSQNVLIENKFEHRLLKDLASAKGITVNTVHGNSKAIQVIQNRFNPDLESMEGAAFLLAANRSGWRAIQLRAISNRVEKRNRDNWNIPLAISNLNTTLIQLIQQLDEN